jgi:hypothetical protein
MRRSNDKISGRRGLLLAALALGTLGLAAGLPAPRPAAAAELGTAVVLGDDYSVQVRQGVRGWPQLLENQGVLDVRANLARENALASAKSGPLSLLGQVAAYEALPGAAPDLTIVYFGNEDIIASKDLAAAKANYQTAVNRLVAAGAASGTRRLVLIQLHDISRNPGAEGDERPQVVDLNRTIKRLVDARPNLISANLGAFFDRVFADPGRFGLTNVTTPNKIKSARTFLYFDDEHFGQRGQQLIAGEIRRLIRRSLPAAQVATVAP